MELHWILVFGLFAPQWWGLSQARAEFSCDGRGSGYYADVESGCQVYHMCDGLGRQFSYTCPNTTLFQQRMLICDHWYMVNCSKSELDYSANLLIGQRDKPFVDDSSENPYHRTPRPDLETYAPMFRQDYRQGKAHFGTNKNLVGGDTDGENTTNIPQYFLPSHWSTQYTKDFTTPTPFKKYKTNEKSTLPEKNTKIRTSFKNSEKKEVITPSRFTLPPFVSTNSFSSKSTPLAERTKDVPTPPRFTLPPFVTTRILTTTEAPRPKITRTANVQTTVFQGFSSSTPKVDVPNLSKILLPPIFGVAPPENKPNASFGSPQNEERDNRPFPRFDPAPQRPKIQEQVLPKVPAPREQAPRFSQPLSNKDLANALKLTRFSTISAPKTTTPYPTKVTTLPEATPPDFLEPSKSFSLSSNEVQPPSLYYQPPSLVILIDGESTTIDPISFYNLVPSKELEPPKINDRVDEGKTILDSTVLKTVTKKQTFFGVPDRSDDKKWKDLRQMFFIPEYDFPLEVGSRPSYESGISSFNVNQAPPGVESRSIDKSAVSCDPKCNPAFLTPGTCQPCVMIRR